jgi:hypothetical protein
MECFTSEFEDGGLIDKATDAEKDLTWMSPTNDASEGILGAYQVFMCRHPNASLPQFNAQAMYNQHDTQDFMDKHLNDDDHKYILQLAHFFDVSLFQPQFAQPHPKMVCKPNPDCPSPHYVPVNMPEATPIGS